MNWKSMKKGMEIKHIYVVNMMRKNRWKNNNVYLLAMCFWTGCVSAANNNINQKTESTLSVEEQINQNIYDEALNLAHGRDFYSAVKG